MGKKKQEKYYLVFNVGCIECGEESFPIVLTNDELIARKNYSNFKAKLRKKGVNVGNPEFPEDFEYFDGGQNIVKVYVGVEE